MDDLSLRVLWDVEQVFPTQLYDLVSNELILNVGLPNCGVSSYYFSRNCLILKILYKPLVFTGFGFDGLILLLNDKCSCDMNDGIWPLDCEAVGKKSCTVLLQTAVVLGLWAMRDTAGRSKLMRGPLEEARLVAYGIVPSSRI
jgi:hypothetical protein